MSTEFWSAFEAQALDRALSIFTGLNVTEQQMIFAELFQKSRYQKMPNAMSVLFRELHEDKSFDDFHEAWLPPQECLKPIEQYGQKFEQFFPAPTRVINAINSENPKEIISIGLHWVAEDQVEKMMAVVYGDANKVRGEKIKAIASKGKAGVYEVKTDENLGVPF